MFKQVHMVFWTDCEYIDTNLFLSVAYQFICCWFFFGCIIMTTLFIYNRDIMKNVCLVLKHENDRLFESIAIFLFYELLIYLFNEKKGKKQKPCTLVICYIIFAIIGSYGWKLSNESIIIKLSKVKRVIILLI